MKFKWRICESFAGLNLCLLHSKVSAEHKTFCSLCCFVSWAWMLFSLACKSNRTFHRICQACMSDLRLRNRFTIEVLVNKVDIPGRQFSEILRFGEISFCDVKVIEVPLVNWQVPFNMIPVKVVSWNLPLDWNPLDLILRQLWFAMRVTHVWGCSVHFLKMLALGYWLLIELWIRERISRSIVSCFDWIFGLMIMQGRMWNSLLEPFGLFLQLGLQLLDWVSEQVLYFFVDGLGLGAFED